jgi:hypothetical protein
MERLEKSFAIGSVLTAIALGGLLYAVYPNNFNPNSSAKTQSYGSTTTAAVQQAPATTNATTGANSAASTPAQNSTGGSQNTVAPSPTPAPSTGSGY